jgi:hypothetical protein
MLPKERRRWPKQCIHTSKFKNNKIKKKEYQQSLLYLYLWHLIISANETKEKKWLTNWKVFFL